MLRVVGLRVIEGRVGSTLLMRLLASSPEVVLDRRHPHGEYRYLSYCDRVASFVTRPWQPDDDPGVTELFFGEAGRFGPLPFDPVSLDRQVLEQRIRRHLWAACSEAMLDQQPSARWYAEKLALPVASIVEAGIPLHLIDLVRDPRDVLVSIRAFTAATGVDGFGCRAGDTEAEYLDRFVRTCAERLDEMAVPVDGVPRVALRYEDVVRDPVGTADRLGRWLELELDPGVFEQSRTEIADHLTTDSVDASVGRWVDSLAPGEADTIWDALGPRLEPWGYTRSPV